jgi:hypothetical protein
MLTAEFPFAPLFRRTPAPAMPLCQFSGVAVRAMVWVASVTLPSMVTPLKTVYL